jgi:hypothetical protein
VARSFIMRWPTLGKQVRCDKLEHNQYIFDWFVDQLPLKAVQGHTVVSGWCLYAVGLALRKHMTWTPGTEASEDLSKDAVGRVHMAIPAGEVMEVVTKYGEATEYMKLITIAQVREEDLPALGEVGAAQWKAVIQTKEVIVVEFVKAKEG